MTRSLLVLAAISPFAFCAAASAQQVSECSKFEMLRLTNQIDRMNHPTMQENKCIADQEMMKAGNALASGDADLCMTHMQNAVQAIHGNPPAELAAHKDCAE